MSRSMFDDLEVSQASAMGAADSRTLRFAAHALTQADLEGLIRYQEAFLSHLEQGQSPVEPNALTTAHELGLKASGLAVKVVELGNAMLRAYSGHHWTARRLRTRLAELEQQSDATSSEKASKARDELRRIEDLEPLARRYGQEAIDLMNQHEDRLVALHTRMQKALTRA
ncbi:hypothetical protein [Archangium lansingense]|uniref:DUF2383 domain-containing protein n=1 Tax=Archangium lansingense TaxID=2995310 RepID=A0ABT4A978_9BACT|nr:hypothetical protein [Archangium lansinium]MCY1078210.1 hypothetical protein [Archangium lansinium]